MASILELCERAQQIAIGRGIDPFKSPVADAGMTLETLVPHAIRACIQRRIQNGGTPQEYLRGHNVPMTHGVGTLPTTVMRDYLDVSYLTDNPEWSSYIPHPDYDRAPYSNLLEYYSSNGSQFLTEHPAPPQILPRRELGSLLIAFKGDAGGVGGNGFTINDVGKRAIAINESGELVFDAFIDPDVLSGDFTLRGLALEDSASGDLYTHPSDDSYAFVRSLTAVTTTIESSVLTCPTGNFTGRDRFRRLQVLDANGDYIVDAIIMTIAGPTSVTMSALANASASGTATATVMDSDYILRTIPCSANLNSTAIEVTSIGDDPYRARYNGQRLYVADASNGTLIIDAIIDRISTPTHFGMRGGTLGQVVATIGIIYRADHYGTIYSGTDIDSTDSSSSFSMDTVTSDADVERRVSIYKSGVLVVDSFIVSRTTGTMVLGAEAIGTNSNCDFSVMGPGVRLTAPGGPSVPLLSTSDLDLSAKLTEDTILTLAGALTGEIPIAGLLN